MLAQVLLFDSPSGFQSAAIFKSLINFKKNYHLKFCLMCKSHHFLSTIRVLQKQKHYNQNNKNRKYTKINHWFNLIFCNCHFWMIAKNEFFFLMQIISFEIFIDLWQYWFYFILFFLAVKHMRSWLPDEGSNQHPLHWKEKS